VLKSGRGQGTTAEIWLPRAEDEAVPAPVVEPAHFVPRSSRPLSVLVVDDDLLVLDNTAAMLDDLGHAVVEARSGEEALQLLHRTPKIDVVVTDYAMSGMNGLKLAEAIAVERPGTPVVLSTGYAELPGSMRPHLPRISKPFDQATLAAVIVEAMREAAQSGSVLTFLPKSA
jgi:CheY-like chemotaxis protein